MEIAAPVEHDSPLETPFRSFHTARVNRSPARRLTGTTEVPQRADRIAAAPRTENVCLYTSGPKQLQQAT